MFLPRGVFRCHVQRIEIVPVGFHLRPLGHGKAHVGEDRRQFFHHLADGVNRAAWAGPPRKRDIQPFRPQTLIQRRIAQGRLAGAERRIHLVLQGVEQTARRLPLAGLHLAQIAHLQADLALLAKGGHAHVFQRRLVCGVGDGGKVLGLERVEPLHGSLRCLRFGASGKGGVMQGGSAFQNLTGFQPGKTKDPADGRGPC